MDLPKSFFFHQQRFFPQKYLLAFSGGSDSRFLLDLLHKARANDLLFAPVFLVHIHHGLQKEADDWADFCLSVARKLDFCCQVVKVDGQKIIGQSPEESARVARYQALSSQMTNKTALLTAHHQKDQVETFLLASIRGSGLAGLSAMPLVKKFADGELWRPILAVSKQQIIDYLVKNKLDFINDSSNDYLHFRRNFIRHKIIEPIKQDIPQFEAMLSKSAQLLNEAQNLQDLLLAKYLPSNSKEPFFFDKNQPYILQKALIRKWLKDLELPMPPYKKLEEFIRQCNESSGGRLVYQRYNIEWQIIKYRHHLHIYKPKKVCDPPKVAESNVWLGVGEISLINKGLIDQDWQKLHWQKYQGNVIFSFAQNLTGNFCKGKKSLKDWLQKAGIAPHFRCHLPLLFLGDELIWVGGLGFKDGFNQLGLRYVADSYSVTIAPFS